MEGVRILAENVEQVPFAIIMILSVITPGLFIFIPIMLWLERFDIPLILWIVSACVMSSLWCSNSVPSITYDVIVDESVSWKEFNDMYEPISQKGDIVTVKLRENSDG